MTTKAYDTIWKHSRTMATLSGIRSLLQWDQETHMPPGAGEIRAQQIELLSGMIHSKLVNKQFSNQLSQCIDINSGTILVKGLSASQRAAMREWRRDYQRAVKLPDRFVKEFAKLTSEALTPWAQARKENAYHYFSPYFEQIVKKCREKAEFLGYKDHPYDALIDEYEPEMTTRKLKSLFSTIKKPIISLLHKICDEKDPDTSFLYGSFSAKKQLQFSRLILDTMGNDTQYSSLDISTHPFSAAAHPTDSRMTTRIHPRYLMENILSTIHEGGHSLYEMGLPKEHYGTPLCQATSYGIHESQSRLWECLVGKSLHFWKHFFPKLKKMFPTKLNGVSLNKFYRAINRVSPGPIRIEADEISYTLHIILRFEIETALIDGSLSLRDLPDAWNQKMQQYLNITPQNNSEGCLQDIHWAMGGIGYFPTYSLGNLYSAHLFNTYSQQCPTWETQLAQGTLSPLRSWLNTHVHQYGRQYTAPNLIKKISGYQLNPQHYLNYLNHKFTTLYSL